jgi:glycosyltransferase involved in cell wall biosynthesis
MRNKRFAVIATANRPHVLRQAIASIVDQVDEIYVIDNGLQEPVPTAFHEEFGDKVYIAQVDMSDGLNLSKLWNIGLELAAGQVGPEEQYEVAVINDDAIVPEGWFDAVVRVMRFNEDGTPWEKPFAAGCSDPDGRLTMPMVHFEPGPIGLQTRLCGWAHIHAGEIGLRYDEDLVWWFQDDDMDWAAREAGGMVMIPGFPVANQFPNGQMTPELHHQAGLDREAFGRKWGGRYPW